MNLEQFATLAKRRRTVRNFDPTVIPKEVLVKLIECAQTAPSGFNLQPTHYYIVQDPEKKKQLQKACLGQRQVVDAPAVVVFTGDRNVIANNLEEVIDSELECGAMTEEYEERYRNYITLNFDKGFGFVWLAKLIGEPLLRLFTPMPSLPAVRKRYWLTKQVMLPAMNFMLAAEAAGLVTAPLEGFDEWRVKRVLGIPMSHVVPIVIPVGYSKEMPKKSRLPLEDFLHYV